MIYAGQNTVDRGLPKAVTTRPPSRGSRDFLSDARNTLEANVGHRPWTADLRRGQAIGCRLTAAIMMSIPHFEIDEWEY
jgi:hypothetical protein